MSKSISSAMKALGYSNSKESISEYILETLSSTYVLYIVCLVIFQKGALKTLETWSVLLNCLHNEHTKQPVVSWQRIITTNAGQKQVINARVDKVS